MIMNSWSVLLSDWCLINFPSPKLVINSELQVTAYAWTSHYFSWIWKELPCTYQLKTLFKVSNILVPEVYTYKWRGWQGSERKQSRFFSFSDRGFIPYNHSWLVLGLFNWIMLGRLGRSMPWTNLDEASTSCSSLSLRILRLFFLVELNLIGESFMSTSDPSCWLGGQSDKTVFTVFKYAHKFNITKCLGINASCRLTNIQFWSVQFVTDLEISKNFLTPHNDLNMIFTSNLLWVEILLSIYFKYSHTHHRYWTPHWC